MSKITILLADNHPVLREGLERLFQQQPGMEVVGQAGDGWDMLQQAQTLLPDLVIMDIRMPNLNGIDACREITKKLPDTRVVALSMLAEKDIVQEMFRAGASGYVTKGCDFDELIRAIEAAVNGQIYLAPQLAGRVMGDYIDSPAPPHNATPLTGRERQILQMLTEGKTTKQVAYQLKLSIKTIETHRRNIMNKLDLHSIAELTKYAIRKGITTLSE